MFVAMGRLLARHSLALNIPTSQLVIAALSISSLFFLLIVTVIYDRRRHANRANRDGLIQGLNRLL